MVNLDLKPYVVVLSDHDSSLGGFRLFTQQEVVSSNPVTWRLKAIDVDARENSGLFILNVVAGRGVFSGDVEMDKLRTLTVSQDLIIPVKHSNPMVYVVFSPNYDSLPSGMKNHLEFGDILSLYYNRRYFLAKMRKYAESKNMSESEQRQLMDSSFARASEVVGQSVQNLKKMIESPNPVPVQKPVQDMQLPIN